MLNITVPANADAACGYYGKCSTEMESVGSWHGKGASALGLSGPVDLADFRKLVRNRTPDGGKLTRDHPDRRPLYDFTFSPPKSVAIAHQVGGDARIKAAVEGAVADAMKLVERRACTRIMRKRRKENAPTGNLVWVDFYHKLSRPVSGIPDPGDHVHVTVLNGTKLEAKWYTPDMAGVVAGSGLIRAEFHASLARRLRVLGYETRRTATAFEIDGIPDSVIRKFSKRQDQIAHVAKVKAPKGRAAIAAITRERKRAELKADKLFEEWLKRLSPNEYRRVGSAVRKAQDATRDEIPLPGADWLENTLETLLVGLSAVPEERLLTETLKRGVGEVVLDDLEEQLESGDFLRVNLQGVDYVTTPEAARRQKEVVTFAKKGGISIRRTKRGEVVPTQAGEMLIQDADKLGFSELHRLAERAQADNFRLVLHAPKARLYSDKTNRGEPLVWLEDVAGLATGQARPRTKLMEQAAAVGVKLRDSVRRQAERLRRMNLWQSHQSEPVHAEHPRSPSRDREWDIGR